MTNNRKYIRFILCSLLIFLFSCSQDYSIEEISDEYCLCSQLTDLKKQECVTNWSKKYKGSVNELKDCKEINYKMIECNGFEGDKDFYRKLMDN